MVRMRGWSFSSRLPVDRHSISTFPFGRFLTHPFANVGRAVFDFGTLRPALVQEADSIDVDEPNLLQVQGHGSRNAGNLDAHLLNVLASKLTREKKAGPALP
jgi:hypothetical protein